MSINVDNKIIETDSHGYLWNLADWDATVAHAIAQNESITLTEKHWQVINFLREFYDQYQLTPTMRVLVKQLAEVHGKDVFNSRILYQLFPDGPIKQGCKIAGLPKPPHCI